jgi:abortive infection bacteriophage resistance protein
VTSSYSRPHLSFQGQLKLLKQRGLVVADDATALAWLRKLGYYRLSAYWYLFRQRTMVAQGQNRIAWQVDDVFQAGASFENAVSLYQFDKQLRLLVMDAIEQIEVAVRVYVAHHLGAQDTFAQENPALFDAKFTRAGRNSEPSDHQAWLTKLTQSTDRSKEDFVNHYKLKYGVPLPIWVSIEVWDFGLLSRFYAGMKFADQAALAQHFGVSRPDVMVSWLRTINYLRNIAAHHSRLWNRNIVDQPKMPRPGEAPIFDAVRGEMTVERVYPSLCVIAYLLEQDCPGSGWSRRLAEHLQAFPTLVAPPTDVKALGCPNGWRQHPFWPA